MSLNENSGLQIVDHISKMSPADRARLAEWFRDQVRELMAQDYYPEIRPIADQLESYASALANTEDVSRRDAEKKKGEGYV